MGESLSENGSRRARRVDPRAGASTRAPRGEPARAVAARGGRGDTDAESCGRSTGSLPASSMWSTRETIASMSLCPTDMPPPSRSTPRRSSARSSTSSRMRVKFSPPDARIELRATVTDDEIVVRVTDHGPGIPARERERVFEPFVRASGATGIAAPVSGSRSRAASSTSTAGGSGSRRRRAADASFVMTLPAVALPAEVLA